jgi:SAM-dependent methyltransferase
MTFDSSISNHYGYPGLMEKIEAGIAVSSARLTQLKVDDLAPVDEFHTRGRVATREVAELANLGAADLVLDVGCGLGGTARYLSHQYGCKVKGVDLTEEYIQVGKRLTELVGLSDRVDLSHGNALRLPFGDDTFDVVWTEHVQMNIENKKAFYSEIARVLKSGGRFVYHDVFRGSSEPLNYPVPWADNENISFLANATDMRLIMEQSFLETDRWIEKTNESVVFFEGILGKIVAEGLPPLGIHLLMGDNSVEKLNNYLSNLKKGCVTVFMGSAYKRSAT